MMRSDCAFLLPSRSCEAWQPWSLVALQSDLKHYSGAAEPLPAIAVANMSTILRTLRNLRRIGFKASFAQSDVKTQLTSRYRSMATRCRYEHRKLRTTARQANLASFASIVHGYDLKNVFSAVDTQLTHAGRRHQSRYLDRHRQVRQQVLRESGGGIAL